MDDRHVNSRRGDVTGWNDGSGSWSLRPILLVEFWGVVVWLVVYLVRSRSVLVAGDTAQPTSPDLVRGQRYARGAIDDDENRRRLGVLRGSAHTGGHR